MKRHPSKDILGTQSEVLRDRTIVLCVTGSVAAVRCADIARGLMRQGAEVVVAMSEKAQKIIHPYLMAWATGNPVVKELTGDIEHVALVGQHALKADLVLVAPATANTISKIACGIDDTVVTTVVSTAFGSGVPIVIVPAMHESMYTHPIVIQNIEKLKTLGVDFIGPRVEEGKAKIAETEEIIEAVLRKLMTRSDLAGRQVLITAGPTLEYIDPVRVITNKSSGKMGIALAREALNRGADVTLIYGPGTAQPPASVKVMKVETTQEMHDALVSELKNKTYDLVIAAAAPADWRPDKPEESKIQTRSTLELTLKLKPTEKIIDTVKKISRTTFLVPFKAEYRLPNDELITRGYRRLVEAEADLIVVNDVGKSGAGFDVDTNEVLIIDTKQTVIHVPLSTKSEIAQKLFDEIVKRIQRGR